MTAILLTNTHHIIFWDDGENSFPQTRKYQKQAEKKLFVKVWKRNDFYRRFLGGVINIEEMGCLSLYRLKGTRFPYCETHLKGGVCALNNAYVILTFF